MARRASPDNAACWQRVVILIFLVFACGSRAPAQSFVHPGGLHTQADLDRMKAQVALGNHPWIDDWNLLITDPQAQNTYTAAPQANMGVNRQRADADAHAAYLNAIRWYISGETSYAVCAVNICNAWSASVNQGETSTNTPGLVGIPIFDFAMAAEVLRSYNGWAPADFARFQNMMETYLYPLCHDFLTSHNGACITNYWANWDACNTGALIAMGVLCDDAAKFNEGVTYFKSGAGNGSIMNAISCLYTPTLGQWQESGRDQEHAQLGIGLLGAVCQVAWNQGVDLFGYSNNRLLAGAEYVAQTNLSQPVPYQYYTNCQSANQDWVSTNGLGRLDDRPVWELIYNHYVVVQGLSAPNSQAMAQLMRLEHGSFDHFGYGTLTFTQSAAASPYPPLPVPAAPTGLTAAAGVSQVTLAWQPSAVNAARGYTVLRATTSGGPYTSIASWTAQTSPQYVDTTVTNGTTYYYVVAANNQAGTSANSAQANATPLAATSTLLSGWSNQDVGTVSAAGSATYGSPNAGTFIVAGTGAGVGGTADTGYNYTYTTVTGNYTITTRVPNVNWNGATGRVGLMMRETLDAGSSALLMTLGDIGNREARFGIRASTGANLNFYNGNDYSVTPAWFRLRRSDNTFTAYESSDGLTWFQVGTSTQAMAATYYVGLIVCTGGSTVTTATFDHLIAIAPAAPTGLSAMSSAGQVVLNWVGSYGAVNYSVKRATVSAGPYTVLANGVTGTSYTDATVASGTTYYYVVTATDATALESVNSVEAEVAGAAVSETGFTPYVGLIVLGQGGSLSVDNSSGTYAGSVVRAGGLTVDGGSAFSTGSTSNEPANLLDKGSASGATNDFFGPLVLGSGPCFVKTTPNAASNLKMTFDSVTRNPGTQLNFGHQAVGSATLASTTAGAVNVVFTTPPSGLMVGGAGATGTKTLSILPFAFVNNALSTYDSTYGLRALNSSTELAMLASGMTAGQNAKVTASTILSANTSVNALWGSGGTVSGTGTLTVASGTIVCNVSFTLANTTLAFGSAEGQINVANSRTLTLSSSITGTGGLTIGLENYNGSSANLILGGANTYTGTTTIEGNDANLVVKLTNALAFQNSTLDYDNYGAGLQFGNGLTNLTAVTFGGLEGAQNLALTNAGLTGGGVVLTVGGDGDSTVYSGVLSGKGGLTKTGAGALTLSGLNTYTGATSVTAGALLVNGSLAAGSAVTAANGGTLGGTGTVNGATTVASGGHLAPGSGGAGVLTFAGAVTLSGGSVLDLGLGAASDQLAFTSYTGPSSGKVTINVSAATGFGAGAYTLITGASGISAASFVLGTVPTGYNYALSASGGTLTLTTTAWTAQEAWRNRYFGTTSNTGNAADSADPDGDGMTNAQEFAAGTNPLDATDALRCTATSASPAGSGMTVSFYGKAGRTYVVEYTASLVTPQWQTLATFSPTADGQIQSVDSASVASRFYRVRTPAP